MNIQLTKKISGSLAAIASLLALVAALGSVSAALEADDVSKMAETWRTVGLFTFATIFGLLAYRPVNNFALWIIVILNKSLLAIIGFSYGSAVSGAHEALFWDALLVIILIAGLWFAYISTNPQKNSHEV
jgi:hypothetical protein